MSDFGDALTLHEADLRFAEDLASAERIASDLLNACQRLAEGTVDGWQAVNRILNYAVWAGMLASAQARNIFMIELHCQATSRITYLPNDRAKDSLVLSASCIATCLFDTKGQQLPASKVARNLRAEANRIEKTLQITSSDAVQLLNGLTARLRECAAYLETGPRGRPSGAVSNFPAELIHRAIAANIGFVEALSDESLTVALLRRLAPDLAEHLEKRLSGPHADQAKADIAQVVAEAGWDLKEIRAQIRAEFEPGQKYSPGKIGKATAGADLMIDTLASNQEISSLLVDAAIQREARGLELDTATDAEARTKAEAKILSDNGHASNIAVRRVLKEAYGSYWRRRPHSKKDF